MDSITVKVESCEIQLPRDFPTSCLVLISKITHQCALIHALPCRWHHCHTTFRLHGDNHPPIPQWSILWVIINSAHHRRICWFTQNITNDMSTYAAEVEWPLRWPHSPGPDRHHWPHWPWTGTTGLAAVQWLCTAWTSWTLWPRLSSSPPLDAMWHLPGHITCVDLVDTMMTGV